MPQIKSADVYNAVAAVLVMGFAWLGWSLWVMASTKSPATIFGIVAVGLILSGITIWLAKPLTLFICTMLATPFVILGFIVFIFERFLQLIFSPICVITTRHLFNPISKSNYCKLCQTCDAIVERSHLLLGSPRILTRPVEEYGFYNQDDLRKSASGCHLCQLLLHSGEVSKERASTVGRNIAPQVVNCDNGVSEDPSSITVRVSMRRHSLRLPILQIELRGESIAKSIPIEIKWKKKDNIRHRCYNSIKTDADDISKWAIDWVEKCCKDHTPCQNEFVPSSRKDYLPLRLLDIEVAEAGTLHLVSTAHLEPDTHVSYCALSHCWGGTVDVKLTKEKLDTMKNIQVHILPKNFQDAIKITNRLGMRYLWIDSLCIVQDDAEEWEVQSTNMGLVYANAKCVISATASKDSTGGCFLTRNLRYNDCVLRESGSEILVVPSFQEALKPSELVETLVRQAPLTARGWTFQERYLAGRTLHFCDGFVLFECNTLTASEHNNDEQKYQAKPNIRSDGKLHSEADIKQVEANQPQYTPAAPNFTGFSTAKHRQIIRRGWERTRVVNPDYTAQQEKQAAMVQASARLGVRGAFEFLCRFKGETLEEKIEFHNSWFEMVQQYSTRELTFGTDKAMAIAGVAYFIQINTGLKYAAGLWSEMLPFNLLWIAPSKPGPRPARSVPTWSWTSVDGMIYHRLSIHRALDPPRPNINIKFRSDWEEVKPLIFDQTLLDEEASNGLVYNATLRLTGTLCKLDMKKVNVTFDISDYPPLEAEGLHCLPVLSFKNFNLHPGIVVVQIHGVVLQDKADSKNRYKRVGYFWTVHQLFKSFQASIIEII